LHLPPRTLDRRIAAGQLRQRYRSRADARPEPVIHPADLARLQPQVLHVAADDIHPANPQHTETALATQPQLRAVAELAGAIAAQFADAAAARDRDQLPLWLTIPEAADYTGLTQEWIRRAIRTGAIQAEKDRGWKIRRGWRGG